MGAQYRRGWQGVWLQQSLYWNKGVDDEMIGEVRKDTWYNIVNNLQSEPSPQNMIFNRNTRCLFKEIKVY